MSMPFARIILIVGLVCVNGCTASRLRQRTINQASTLPELQYEQVLTNLALFATNPSALPWHVNLREGTTQITDSATAGGLVDLEIGTTRPELFGSRTVVAQWGAAPVIDVTELRLLRIAYRRAHGADEMPSPDLLDDVAHMLKDQFAANADLRYESQLFYDLQGRAQKDFRQFKAHVITTNDAEFCTESVRPNRVPSPLAQNVCRQVESLKRDLARIQPGWFRVGRKRDVPKKACYVGSCGDCYVWVEPYGYEALTEFTLTVLKISSLIKETQTLISPGTVKFSPADRGGG
jgi:hypothetical protein